MLEMKNAIELVLMSILIMKLLNFEVGLIHMI
mgnify:CR=1 FL=1